MAGSIGGKGWTHIREQAITVCGDILADDTAPEQLRSFATSVRAYVDQGGFPSRAQIHALSHCIRRCSWCKRKALYRAGLYGGCTHHRNRIVALARYFNNQQITRNRPSEQEFDDRRQRRDHRDLQTRRLRGTRTRHRRSKR